MNTIKKQCTKCNCEIDKFDMCDKCHDAYIKNMNKHGTTDYQFLVNKDSPESVRKMYRIGPIWDNSLVCDKCHQRIRSKNAHNFTMCRCGQSGIDGGSWGCNSLGTGTLTTEYFSDVDVEKLGRQYQ